MPPYMMGEAFAGEKRVHGANDAETIVVQGNLDPLLLVAGGEALEARAEEILDIMAGKPFIFNLGHGIVPETPPENVARLVEVVRNWTPDA
jgi:uroporphyrinogen decarboxylase